MRTMLCLVVVCIVSGCADTPETAPEGVDLSQSKGACVSQNMTPTWLSQEKRSAVCTSDPEDQQYARRFTVGYVVRNEYSHQDEHKHLEVWAKPYEACAQLPAHFIAESVSSCHRFGAAPVSTTNTMGDLSGGRRQ